MMLARVAENIYWMARYLERAEDLARLIKVNANLTLDLPKGLSPIWGQLIAITGAEDDYASRDYNEQSVLRFLISNQSPLSLLSCVSSARENARTVRDVMPREVWEAINTLYLQTRERQQQAISKRGRFDFLVSVIEQCQMIAGILAGTMNRDEGYTFLRIGRYLERADMTSRIIDIRSANLVPDATLTQTTYDNLQWMSVLKSLTGYQMYRLEMQTRIQRREVLRFLFQSQFFPRSIGHCMSRLQELLSTLPNHERVLVATHRIKRQLDNADLAKLKQTELQLFIDQLQVGFGGIHDDLVEVFFSGLGAAKTLHPAQHQEQTG
ncbi:MAG: alpha-E domain-containing protein [Spongiibacteraceae bacterium]|jgi:uncharacterized alpha-E superfamily protein|nr:alpha-E domain-containing protein [Spongiibacteraceae bacterium]